MQLRDYLFKKIENDPNFSPIYVNNDYSSPFLDEIKKDSPERVLNVGIAEQIMVTAAAGIKKSGLHSICYSISTFLFSRANEQIKINFLSQKIPFFFISMGPGFDYPEDGPSHHSIEENNVTFSYPNTFIFNPITELCIDKHYDSVQKNNSSNIIFSILRKKLDESEDLILNSEFTSFKSGYLYQSKNATNLLICHGYTGHLCLKNFEKLKELKTNIVIFTNLKGELPKLDFKKKSKLAIWSESLTGSGFFSYHLNEEKLSNNFPITKEIGVVPCDLIPYYGDRKMQSEYYGYDFSKVKNFLS